MAEKADYTGVRFGNIVGIAPTEKRRHNKVVWRWLCDCGKEFENIGSMYVCRGYGRCHECAMRHKSEATKERASTHKMSGTLAHRIWKGIKQRCLNSKRKDYAAYGAVGITISKEFSESFGAFYEYLGPIPDDGRVYSCGRIDNDLGYERGNIRWETTEQQSRNHRIRSNNRSGTNGVHLTRSELYPTWVAAWKDENGKSRTKSFSVNKYGDEFARFLAEECRDVQIRRLNLILGNEGYSPKHGL